MAQIKVLFVAANTNQQATLQLRREFEQIRGFLELTPEGDAIVLIDEQNPPATRLHDLILRKQPDVVHFAGHADAAGRLQFPQPNAAIGRITPDTLDGLFRDSVKLVVFNTCYSAAAAEVVRKQVDFCIGTKSRLADL